MAPSIAQLSLGITLTCWALLGDGQNISAAAERPPMEAQQEKGNVRITLISVSQTMSIANSKVVPILSIKYLVEYTGTAPLKNAQDGPTRLIDIGGKDAVQFVGRVPEVRIRHIDTENYDGDLPGVLNPARSSITEWTVTGGSLRTTSPILILHEGFNGKQNEFRFSLRGLLYDSVISGGK